MGTDPMRADAMRTDDRLLSLGQLIAGRRRDRGLSQREVARRMWRSNSVLSRWEADLLEPTLVDLSPLSRVLGTTIDALVADAVAPPGGRRWSSRATPISLRVAVGRELERERKSLGVTKLEVYLGAGIAGLRLVRLEAGADPSVRELLALRSLYGLRLDEVVRRARLAARGMGPISQMDSSRQGTSSSHIGVRRVQPQDATRR
jgi:transcriptional regulator with XRE-family HTH domain